MCELLKTSYLIYISFYNYKMLKGSWHAVGYLWMLIKHFSVDHDWSKRDLFQIWGIGSVWNYIFLLIYFILVQWKIQLNLFLTKRTIKEPQIPRGYCLILSLRKTPQETHFLTKLDSIFFLRVKVGEVSLGIHFHRLYATGVPPDISLHVGNLWMLLTFYN